MGNSTGLGAVLRDKRHLGGIRHPEDIFMLATNVTGWVCVSQKRNEKGDSLILSEKFQCGVRGKELDEGSQKAQTSSYKKSKY